MPTPLSSRQLQWGRGHSTAEIASARGREHRRAQRFNGAAVIRPRKWPTSAIGSGPMVALQWGRGHSTAEIGRLARRHADRATGFNGAAVIRPRKCAATSAVVDAATASASMGPRSFDRGNAAAIGRRWRSSVGFNGAAVIRPRKSSDGAPDRLQRPSASMGPRSFDRGNRRTMWLPMAWHDRLQWGRGHSTAEMRDAADRPAATIGRLQWGRGHSTAEMTRCTSRREPTVSMASMGPRSFDRGNGIATPSLDG